MFASQFSEIMSAVIQIGKKRDLYVETPRVGTNQVDGIIAKMLRELDDRLDKAEAEKEALRKELEGFKSAPVPREL